MIKMDFINQSWFWTGLFALLGSLLSILGIIMKEWFANRSQIKIERLKLYESDLIKTYKELYDMISFAYGFWPPSDLRQEFIDLIKSSYFKKVRANKLFYSEEIRELLNKFEYQYKNLDELGPEALNEFFRNEFINILERLEIMVEQRIDQILQERK